MKYNDKSEKGGGGEEGIVTFNFVIRRLRREGVWCNWALVTNCPVFFMASLHLIGYLERLYLKTV